MSEEKTLLTVEITKGEIAQSKKGKTYLSLTYNGNGKTGAWASSWETDGYKGPGKYEVESEDTTKEGKTYTNFKIVKFLSPLFATPGGTPVATLDPNSIIRERASSARTAVMTAKDIVVASLAAGAKYTEIQVAEGVDNLARAFFKTITELTTEKK